MHVDWLDLILLLLVASSAVSGYRQGFVVGVLSFVGLLGGAVVGAFVGPPIARMFDGQHSQAIAAILVVFGFASIGMLAATTLGGFLRRLLRWRQARVIDSAGGAAASVVSALIIAWFLGLSVAHSPFTVLSRQVNNSLILATVDDVMPDGAQTWFSDFQRIVVARGFPQVFAGLGNERVVAVDPPDPAVLESPDVKQARASVVKIVGVAKSCQRRVEGSGFVYAPQHVMTNAHVVAGVTGPQVRLDAGGTVLNARVVLYDPDLDVAVLYVPGLNRAPLGFAPQADTGDDAVVAGYPQDGPYSAVPARVRSVENARGPDIYQTKQLTREIYSIRGDVEPGNSGGPLLTPGGQVLGVVFAKAVDRSDTGYALTAAQVGDDARSGAARSTAVSTGSCD